MTRTPNAFQSVRPRAAAAPSAAFRPHTPGRAPALLRGSTPRALVMDAKGKRCVPLAPRLNGAFAIESGAAAQAATDKRQALRKAGI